MSDSPDVFDEDGDDSFSYRRLLDYITEQKELIVTIQADDLIPLKRNLATLKSRDAAKLKSAGLQPADDVLSYDELPCDKEECVRIHIKLGPRKGVKILKLELPDDTI